MSRENGYVQLRRGLYEHVRDGRLTFTEASFFVLLTAEANPTTGVAWGNAGLFAAMYAISPRTCRDWLERLEEKGYVKRFPTRGKHGSHPILINKYFCSDGAMKGMYLNALLSISSDALHYDSCDERVNDDVNDGVHEGAASIENREKRIEKPKPELPDWLPWEPWAAYVEMRRKIKKPLTLRASELAIIRLGKFRAAGHDPVAILEQSTFHDWQGLFEVKPGSEPPAPKKQYVAGTWEEYNRLEAEGGGHAI